MDPPTFLELSREEIEQWLKDCEISYCIDETNQEDEYTRNRIRHHIIPVLEEQVNTRAIEHFVKLSEQAEEIYEYLEKADRSGMEYLCRTDRRISKRERNIPQGRGNETP